MEAKDGKKYYIGDINDEYPALRPPGFHDINVSDLKRIFVEPFGSAGARRSWLCERFSAWFKAIEEVGIPFELWINGSFATHKPEPGDIDIVWIFDSDNIQTLPSEAGARLDMLLDMNRVKREYACHVQSVMKGDKAMYEYWIYHFGHDRSESPKGLFRIFSGGKA